MNSSRTDRCCVDSSYWRVGCAGVRAVRVEQLEGRESACCEIPRPVLQRTGTGPTMCRGRGRCRPLTLLNHSVVPLDILGHL